MKATPPKHHHWAVLLISAQKDSTKPQAFPSEALCAPI